MAARRGRLGLDQSPYVARHAVQVEDDVPIGAVDVSYEAREVARTRDMDRLARMGDDEEHPLHAGAFQAPDIAADSPKPRADDAEASQLVRATDRHQVATAEEPLVTATTLATRHRRRQEPAVEQCAQLVQPDPEELYHLIRGEDRRGCEATRHVPCIYE